MEEKNVLIIGAGIAGLTLAISLREKGINASIYEAYPYRKDAGAGFLLSPNGAHVLNHYLNVSEELLQNSWCPDAIGQYNIDGKIRSKHYFIDEDSNKFNVHVIARSSLMNILLEKAEKIGIEVHYNKRLVYTEQNQVSVKAYFDDDTCVSGTQLIGADGINSKTRQLIFPETRLHYAGYWYAQGLISTDDVGLISSDDEYKMYTKDFSSLFLLSRCHPGNQNNFEWLAVKYQERKLPTNAFEQLPEGELRAYLLQQFGDWGEPIPTAIQKTEKIHIKTRFEFKPLENWSKGRIVLIGDAIHGPSPVVGQGVSIALEDAVYLAHLLAKHEYNDAYYYFEHDRRPRVQRMLDETMGYEGTWQVYKDTLNLDNIESPVQSNIVY